MGMFEVPFSKHRHWRRVSHNPESLGLGECGEGTANSIRVPDPRVDSWYISCLSPQIFLCPVETVILFLKMDAGF